MSDQIAVPSDGAPAPETAASSPAEPQGTEAPQDEFQWAGGQARDELGRWATKQATEQTAQQLLETIAAQETITVADLRKLPEAKGFSDAQLQQLWEEVSGTGNKAPVPEPPKPTTPRSWKVYKDNAEVADFSKMTAEEFLALQFGYQANNKEQRKAFDELVRNAQQGHYNAERTNTLTQQLREASQWRQQHEPKLQQYESERKIWDAALSAATRQDYQPLQKLLEAYAGALGAPVQEAAPAPAGPTAEDWHVYNTEVLPAAERIAKEHGFGVKEVADSIMQIIAYEPVDLTRERFDQIVSIELPHLIQEFKAAQAPAVDPRDAEIERLKAEVAEAKKAKVTEHNAAVTTLHQRRKAAPPPAPRQPANSAPEVSGIEDGASAREWLRNWKG